MVILSVFSSAVLRSVAPSFTYEEWQGLSDEQKDSYFKIMVEKNGGIFPDGAGVSGKLGDRLSYDYYIDSIDITNRDTSFGTRYKSSLNFFGKQFGLDFNLGSQASNGVIDFGIYLKDNPPPSKSGSANGHTVRGSNGAWASITWEQIPNYGTGYYLHIIIVTADGETDVDTFTWG